MANDQAAALDSVGPRLRALRQRRDTTLDELVDVPTGDPRVHPRPIVRCGMTFLPLTRRPGGVQAYKQIIPPQPSGGPSERGTHDDHDWLYVLSGRIRLQLGEHDLMLAPGEVAEFDTRIPHSVTNPGPGTAEVLNQFSPQGERFHVRTRPTRPRTS